MIPGIFGDEPQLADFRSRVSETVLFDVLTLPDLRSRGRVLTDMVATGRCLAEEIGRRQPTGPVALLGFSFGASLALEVAGQIETAGRDISFLGILDGPFDLVDPLASGHRPPALAVPGRMVKALAVEAVESSDVVRHLVLSAVASKADSDDQIEPMRRAMLWHLRGKALRRWRPMGCRAPGLHVATGLYGAVNRERWSELCPNLDHVHVDAVHEHLLKGEALEAVVSAVTTVVRGRIGTAPARGPSAGCR